MHTDEAVNDTCRFKKSKASAHISGYRDVMRGNETALQLAVATVGPVSVGVDSDGCFQFYGGGVYDDAAQEGLCRSPGFRCKTDVDSLGAPLLPAPPHTPAACTRQHVEGVTP